jgi:hypothetical protein
MRVVQSDDLGATRCLLETVRNVRLVGVIPASDMRGTPRHAQGVAGAIDDDCRWPLVAPLASTKWWVLALS